ncbi:hypothetical protein C461_11678 [Halorubrum aidingense JCM 13560]|uniref:Uncharacterized protein n=1 Tax=Halorubrum aidingense JCM 13560 TaxID=1230454 RepID=M0PAX3_9EURY|nr:hypothetical protein [Halorubrum aidingense]EMA66699.1 hypothetical protein C461_11678 [Halorubrum aidingense JCM 13560]
MTGFESLRRTADRLRRPEYTGENRCLPCTVLNAAIVGVAAIALSRRNRPLGVLALVAGAALISLRGYVVPGTPQFAPALVEPLPVEVGHESPAGVESGSLADDRDPEAMMAALVEADVIVPDGDQLYLDDAFQTAWEERMAELRDLSGAELAARTAAVSHDSVEGSYHDGRVLLAGNRDAWLSQAVAIAETAAVETLADRGLSHEVRVQAAEPLRTFVRTCPVCGGDVTDTTLRNCCGGPGGVSGNPERPVRACADCDAVVFADLS